MADSVQFDQERTLVPRWLNPLPVIGIISETRYWAYLMLIPGIILISVVIFYPVLSGIRLSFHEYKLLRPNLGQPYVGLDQYVDLFADDVFWVSVRNTIVFGVFNVICPFTLGLITAVALKTGAPGGGPCAHVDPDALVYAVGGGRAYVGAAPRFAAGGD